MMVVVNAKKKMISGTCLCVHPPPPGSDTRLIAEFDWFIGNGIIDNNHVVTIVRPVDRFRGHIPSGKCPLF